MLMPTKRRNESGRSSVTARPRLQVVFLMLAACALPASAQWSASATLSSDYRYRGISLSGGEPAVSIAANVDSAWGGYAGASIARARMRYTQVDAQVLLYAGFAKRWGSDASWDIGVTGTRYHGSSRYDYRELHAGVSMERFSVRVYTAAHYFGVGSRSVYMEVNGSHPLTDHIDLVGHVGYLNKPDRRADLRIGISAALGAWTTQLAWVAASEDAPLYPALYTRSAQRAVVSLTRSF